MKKVLIILGPTASGKSALAVKLAKKFGGEIISADSRQVYKDLDIGTGKITKKEMLGIPHHLLDVANPKNQFSASEYKNLAEKSLIKIVGKNKLPIVVGGTGFYIDALTGVTDFPEVPANTKLRKMLEKHSTEKLFEILKKKDPERAETIDAKNKVRLIRALEIIEVLGKVPNIPTFLRMSEYDFVYIGLKPDDLDKKIEERLIERLTGIIGEVKKLHKKGVSWKRMYELGLEYRYVSMYVQKLLNKKELIKKLYSEIRKYSKRQMTWFKRNKKIKWFTPLQYNEIEKYIKSVL